jgi:hypothetical protein
MCKKDGEEEKRILKRMQLQDRGLNQEEERDNQREREVTSLQISKTLCEKNKQVA